MPNGTLGEGQNGTLGQPAGGAPAANPNNVTGDINLTGNVVTPGLILCGGIEDMVNTDGVRMPQGFVATGDSSIAGDLTVTTLNRGPVLRVFSATVDLMNVGFYNFNTPNVAGKKFVFITGRVELTTRDAALTTTPSLAFAQNNADIVALSTAVANAASISAVSAPENITYTPAVVPDVDTSVSPLQVHVTTAAAGTGLTTCTGKLYIMGIYV